MSKPEPGDISRPVPAAGNGARSGHSRRNVPPVTMTMLAAKLEEQNTDVEHAIKLLQERVDALITLNAIHQRERIGLLIKLGTYYE